MAAMVSLQGTDREPPAPNQLQCHNNNNNCYKSSKTFHQCSICNGRHMETKFIHQGDK